LGEGCRIEFEKRGDHRGREGCAGLGRCDFEDRGVGNLAGVLDQIAVARNLAAPALRPTGYLSTREPKPHARAKTTGARAA
jgi:hypothetical protein